MFDAPAKRLLWIVAALLTVLASTVTLFEHQQALRKPVLFESLYESR